MVPPGCLHRDQRQGPGGRPAPAVRRGYWDWEPLVTANRTGFFPYTPAVNLMFALNEALDILPRKACPPSSPAMTGSPRRPAWRVRAWGLELQCQDPRPMHRGNRGAHAGGPQRRRVARRDPGPVQHEPGKRSGAHRGPGVPYRPHGRSGDLSVRRHAGRRRDGVVSRERAASAGRGAGGDGLPGTHRAGGRFVNPERVGAGADRQASDRCAVRSGTLMPCGGVPGRCPARPRRAGRGMPALEPRRTPAPDCRSARPTGLQCRSSLRRSGCRCPPG